MSSQDVIKSTAKKLKYYMEVKRLEDAFDLSGPDKPQRHYPTLKPRPTLLYDGLHDRSLKHYFKSPEVKKHMTQMRPRSSAMASEDKVRRDVDKYMTKTQYTNPYSTIVRPKATAPKKRRSNFRGGPLMLRSKHGPYLSKGETERLVNTATKLLVASETIPIENGKKNRKYSARVYSTREMGPGGSLPIIESSATYPPRRPDRPRSTYGIRPKSAMALEERPKTSRGIRPKSAVYNPSTKRYGYDQYGQRIRIRPTPPPNHYEASESETEDDISEDAPTNILVPVRSGASQTPEWLNIQMSKVDMAGGDMQLVDADMMEEEEEEDDDSIYQEPTILQNDMALVSYDNTTQTGVETSMQTVERDNTQETQTRRANTVEALTDPWQAEISMQTEPPPITSGTQTVAPPPEMSTQTLPPPPEMSTQTVAPCPEISTQTPAVGPAMSTQTLPEMSTQTIPAAISTQTDEPPLEISTQITPDPTPSPSEEEEEELDDYDHLRHGPRLKSGKRTVYEMAIHTGNRLGASTRADVHIILYGEKGNTGKIKLKQTKETKDGKKMKFQKGQIDVFKVESFYVGKLECVTIGHDRRELGCGWFLDKLMIREYGDDISYEFVVERWLSAQDEDGRTVRTLPVTNIIMDVSSSGSDSEGTDYVERSADSSVYTDTDPHLSQITETDSHFITDGGSSRSGRRRRHRRRRVVSTTTATETDSDSDVSDTERSHGDRTTDHTYSSGSGSSSDDSGSSSGSETEGGDQSSRGRGGKGDGDSDHEGRGGQRGYFRGGEVEEPQHSEPLPTDVRDASVSIPKQSTPINSRHPSPHPPSSSDEKKGPDVYMSGYLAGIKAKEEADRKKKEQEEEEEERKRQEEERLLSGPSIHECCKKGDLDRVKALIKLKPELKDTPDERGWTPLHCSTSSGNVDIVKWLIVNDVNVNMLTPTGYNGMHQAAMNGHVNIMMVLAAMGVEINCKTVDQQTPLHLAAMSGHIDSCRWLVANKACEDCEDIMGRSALDLASDYQHSDVEKFLTSCRKELKQEDSSLSQLRSQSPTRSPSQAVTNETLSEEDAGAAGGSDSNRPVTPKQSEKNTLMARQKSFHEQQNKMSTSGMSFLDSIRAEYEDKNQEQAAF
nr:uncharacterized protein LOC129269368 [Lytechinus pictus]